MRRLTAAAVTIALALAACGGDGDGDKDQAADDTTTTSTTVPSDTTTTTATTLDPNAPNATGTGQGATAPANSGGTGGTGQQGTTGTTARAGRNTNNSAIKSAAPGAYTYTRTGSARTSAFGERNLNGPVNLQVDPPNTATGEQRSVQSSQDGSSEQVIRLLPEGAYFTYLKQSSGGLSKEFRPNPAVLAVPSNPTPGRTWAWTVTSTDGATTLNASFKVERTEALTIGGQRTNTHVLTVVLKITGDIEATTNQTTWVSLDRGLIVRTDERSDGRFGNITFNSQSSMTLNSLNPA